MANETPRITKEMLDAGLLASWGSTQAPRFVRQMLIRIYRAMASAAAASVTPRDASVTPREKGTAVSQQPPLPPP